MILFGRSQNRFPVVSLDFSVTYSFRPYHGSGVDSVPSENKYQQHFLGLKAAGAWNWQTLHIHVPNIMEIWEPKSPGTLWASPRLLRYCFTFLYINVHWTQWGRLTWKKKWRQQVAPKRRYLSTTLQSIRSRRPWSGWRIKPGTPVLLL